MVKKYINGIMKEYIEEFEDGGGYYINHFHKLDGPIVGLKNPYWVDHCCYVNFLEYIREIIKYKKDNK